MADVFSHCPQFSWTVFWKSINQGVVSRILKPLHTLITIKGLCQKGWAEILTKISLSVLDKTFEKYASSASEKDLQRFMSEVHWVCTRNLYLIGANKLGLKLLVKYLKYDDILKWLILWKNKSLNMYSFRCTVLKNWTFVICLVPFITYI